MARSTEPRPSFNTRNRSQSSTEACRQAVTSRTVIGGLGFLTVGAIFAGDLATPEDVAMASLAVVPVAVVSWFAERFCLPILAAVALTTSITATAGNLSVQSAAAVIVACVSVAVIVRLALQARVAPPPPPATRLTVVKEPVAEGPNRLTARERQVVELAAGGLTAREIGLRLFIGERTVETHLGNSYAKLGVGSKRELIQRTLASTPGTDQRSPY